MLGCVLLAFEAYDDLISFCHNQENRLLLYDYSYYTKDNTSVSVDVRMSHYSIPELIKTYMYC